MLELQASITMVLVCEMVLCCENYVLLVTLVLVEWIVGFPSAVHYLQLLV
jgi:hypothetical protein